MKIVSIVGARPQFIKCAPLSRAIRKEHTEVLVHTGQHYDPEMSDVFFEDLLIPEPDYNLDVGSGTHGKQTGDILARVENVLEKEGPDIVIVFGDTNSTLAGALAAVKLHIPVAHVEAGLRSFDRAMPEEINRVVTDHVSDLLFCPTETAVVNLRNEGVTRGVYLTGDVMVDGLWELSEAARRRSQIMAELGLSQGNFILLTLHRPENTDNSTRLTGIIESLLDLARGGMTIVFPCHPRTEKQIKAAGLWGILGEHTRVLQPVGYYDMLALQRNASIVMTDSGGVQKEVCYLGGECVTLRNSTEWIETLKDDQNVLVGADKSLILATVRRKLEKKGERRVLQRRDIRQNASLMIATLLKDWENRSRK